MDLRKIIDEITAQLDRITLYNEKMSNAQIITYLINLRKDIDDIEDTLHDDCCDRNDLDLLEADLEDKIENLNTRVDELEKENEELKEQLDEDA